jgi:hypothetical protein
MLFLTYPNRQAASSIPNHIYIPGARSYPGHTDSPLDEPAKTLKAGVHGVPGGENMLALPSGEVRYFTVREARTLESLNQAMAEAVNSITEDDTFGWFNHCGLFT